MGGVIFNAANEGMDSFSKKSVFICHCYIAMRRRTWKRAFMYCGLRSSAELVLDLRLKADR